MEGVVRGVFRIQAVWVAKPGYWEGGDVFFAPPQTTEMFGKELKICSLFSPFIFHIFLFSPSFSSPPLKSWWQLPPLPPPLNKPTG